MEKQIFNKKRAAAYRPLPGRHFSSNEDMRQQIAAIGHDSYWFVRQALRSLRALLP